MPWWTIPRARPGRPDLGGSARLTGIERVQAADDDPRIGHVADVGDLGVLEDRALGDELAVLDVHLGHLHRDPGVEAGCQARADLEAEQAAAEQRVAEVVVRHHLRHHVDDRLREALGGVLGPVDLAGAVSAQPGRRVVGDIADHERRSLGAELAGQLRCLGERAWEFLLKLPSSSWRA